MEFHEDNPIHVIVNLPLLAILIRNVLDNAIKYTPNNGTILISLEGKTQQLVFSVEDSGPGIEPDQYEKSLQRFHRCIKTAKAAPGTGLGLSIVQAIMDAHEGRVDIDSELGRGTTFTLTFPIREI